MKIEKSRPPNYDKIARVFHRACGFGVIFAYGDTLYNPSGVDLPPSIIAHEELHGRRQVAMGVEEWWDRYLTDIPFRYNEELLAHREEYRVAAATGSRNERRRALHDIAKRLASSLYGNMVTMMQAVEDLRYYDKNDTVEKDVTHQE